MVLRSIYLKLRVELIDRVIKLSEKKNDNNNIIKETIQDSRIKRMKKVISQLL